jgi:hypothetical protein
MCDIEKERRKVDVLLDTSISAFWFEDPRNKTTLVELACKCLHEDYCHLCSDGCIRARCEDYIALRLSRPEAWL